MSGLQEEGGRERVWGNRSFEHWFPSHCLPRPPIHPPSLPPSLPFSSLIQVGDGLRGSLTAGQFVVSFPQEVRALGCTDHLRYGCEELTHLVLLERLWKWGGGGGGKEGKRREEKRAGRREGG